MRIAGGNNVGDAARVAARTPRVRGCSRRLWVAKPLQEVQQVVGILPSGIEADGESDVGVGLGDLLEAFAQLGIAAGRFDELQIRGGGLKIVAQEDGVVTIA